MANELKTSFKFDDKDGAKVDALRGKLENLNDLLNRTANNKNFGLNPTFGSGLNISGLPDASTTRKSGNELRKITSDINKALTDDLKKESKIRAAEVEAINSQTLKNAKQQADFRNAITRRAIDAEIAEERRLDKYRQQSSRDKARLLGTGSSSGGGGGFSDSFGSRLGINPDFGSAAFLGGAAAGVAITAATAVKDAVAAVAGEVKDLTVESVKLAANFQETTNSLAVFAGSVPAARQELKAIDDVALDTPGLRLQDAEIGYQRLRALGFQAKISQDLIKGLGTQRVLSGATSDAVDRVVTNLIQLRSGAGTAADVRQTVGQLPTLLPVFQKAFGTQDFGDINKIFKTDPQALQKFSDELAKAQQAQAGLNVTIEKGADTLIQTGRVFGEPLLQPLTRDVRDLTEYLRENESTAKSWGQSFADAYNGVSQSARAFNGQESRIGKFARVGLGVATYGVSEAVAQSFFNFESIGKKAREEEEAKNAPKIFEENIKKGISGGNGVKYVFDAVTNTVRALPSIAEKLETEKAVEESKELQKIIERVKAELSALPLKFALDEVSQNLEIQKAIAVRDAKGNALKIAKDTAALEISALQQQIILSDKIAQNKIQNLTSDEAQTGKGLVIAQENAANIAKLQNQIVLTQINAQKQQFEIVRNLKTEFSDFITSTKSADNPYVKIFHDIDTAGSRAEKRFGSLGKAAAEFERVALNKQLNQLRFTTGLDALKFRQEARRTDNLPLFQTAEFTKALSSIERNVQHIADSTDLRRKTNEAEYYARQFNPNNPKTYDEFTRGGAYQNKIQNVYGSFGANRNVFSGFNVSAADLSEIGKQISNAKEEFAKLDSLAVGVSGILGKEKIADRKLALLPSQEELAKRLSSPFGNVRSDAQFGLNQRADAYRIKAQAEEKRFQDSIELEKFQDLRKTDFREQIDLLGKSKGLDREFAAKTALGLANEIGVNNLDGKERMLYRDANRELSSINLGKEREAERERQERKERDKNFDGVIQKIDKLFGAKGLKVEIGDQQIVYVKVESKDGNVKTSTSQNEKRATAADTAAEYTPSSISTKGKLTNR